MLSVLKKDHSIGSNIVTYLSFSCILSLLLTHSLIHSLSSSSLRLLRLLLFSLPLSYFLILSLILSLITIHISLYCTIMIIISVRCTHIISDKFSCLTCELLSGHVLILYPTQKGIQASHEPVKLICYIQIVLSNIKVP